jgi:hypothetical protein
MDLQERLVTVSGLLTTECEVLLCKSACSMLSVIWDNGDIFVINITMIINFRERGRKQSYLFRGTFPAITEKSHKEPNLTVVRLGPPMYETRQPLHCN